ncbi:MAG: NFACT family protein [Candidatus Tectomicrobia bacterium]|uniref:NFACT family protein n=1 Tax=Tectimicrobiota bacterium TaxID=2528274 RepID=A0A932FY27_UNCTE|nr:NFACT family protein [Candidatus Tectomicrobia bacterium]
MDIFVLKAIVEELKEALVYSRVSKVFQVNENDLVINFWGRGENRLYLSVDPELGRLHLTGHKPLYPPAPLRFAAYLRSHLAGARLMDLHLTPFDRVVTQVFQRKDAEGNMETFCLIAEIIGRHGNILLTTGEGTILEALRHLTPQESPLRPILPGEMYRPLPPPPSRLKLAQLDRESLRERPQASLLALLGMGPLLTRALEQSAAGDPDLLWKTLEEWRTRYLDGPFIPQILQLPDGKRTLCAFDLPHLPVADRQVFEGMNQAADAFYGPRLQEESFQGGKKELQRFLEKEKKRLRRKLENLEGDHSKLEGYLKLKEYADLLIAQQAAVTKGASSARLVNYYSPEMEEVEVPLDVRLSARENAEAYYKKYRKARNGLDRVAELQSQTRTELEYVEGLLYQVEEAEDLETLSLLQEEVRGSLKWRPLVETRDRPSGANRAAAPAPRGAASTRSAQLSQWCRRFTSSEGWEILCGKSNRGNDWLLRSVAKAEDIWLHAQGFPGSHVLIRRKAAGEVPERTLLEAAQVAAYYSKGKNSTKVPILYTPARHVRKPPGTPSGQVTVSSYKTLLVRPEVTVTSLPDNAER